MRIRFWKSTVTSCPTNENDIPLKWNVATAFYVLGHRFILWEN